MKIILHISFKNRIKLRLCKLCLSTDGLPVKCGWLEVSAGPKKADIFCWAFATFKVLKMTIASVGRKQIQLIGKRKGYWFRTDKLWNFRSKFNLQVFNLNIISPYQRPCKTGKSYQSLFQFSPIFLSSNKFQVLSL